MSVVFESTATTDKSNDGASYLKELHELQEKTKTWKQSVANQLAEAARKNKQLRDELKEANVGHEAEMAALRLNLDKEFKERTALKDEEILDLKALVATLREEKRFMAEQHERDVEQTAERIRKNCYMESASKFEADLAQRETEARQLMDTIRQKDDALRHAAREAETKTTQLARLEEQYRELLTLITHNAERTIGDDSVGGGFTTLTPDALNVTDAAHQKQLEMARLELRGLEEKYATRLHEAKAAHEVERQRWMDDLYRREEQLSALQTLLRQAQHEAETAQRRIAAVTAEKERSEGRSNARVAELSEELACQTEQSRQLAEEAERLRQELGRQKSLLHSLEEEATMREEAFTSLLLSEENRALMQGLQTALQESRAEAEEWHRKYNEALNHARHNTTTAVSFGECEKGTDSSNYTELAQREEALAAESSRLDLKAKLLKATEARLEELKRSIAFQASSILQQNSSDGDSENRYSKNSKKERPGRSFFASQRRYGQMTWELYDNSIFFLFRYLASYLTLRRLRVVVLLFLCSISLVLIILAGWRGAGF